MEDDKPPSKIMVVRSGCGASGRPDNIQFWIALEKLVLRRKSSLQCCMDTRRTYTRNDGAMVCHIICSFKAAILALAGATVAPAAGRPKGFCWVTHTKKTLKQHQMAKTHRKSKRTHKSNEFGFLQWQICWVFLISQIAPRRLRFATCRRPCNMISWVWFHHLHVCLLFGVSLAARSDCSATCLRT